MKVIHLTQRTARLLREQLEMDQKGYDYLDTQRLRHLEDRLQELQGEYGERMAELSREERATDRGWANEQMTDAAYNKTKMRIRFEAEDAHEAATGAPAHFRLETADWKLVRDKVCSDKKFSGARDLLDIIISMREAVESAEDIPDSPKADADEAEVPPRKMARVK